MLIRVITGLVWLCMFNIFLISYKAIDNDFLKVAKEPIGHGRQQFLSRHYERARQNVEMSTRLPLNLPSSCQSDNPSSHIV